MGALLALPLSLAAAPEPQDAALASHRAEAQLGAHLELLLGRLAQDAPAPGAAPPEAPAAARGGGHWALAHVMAGERRWSVWVAVGGAAQPLDLEGDGAAELTLQVTSSHPRALALAGLGPARVPWAVWLEDGGASWGLLGAGSPPAAVAVSLGAGELHLRARGASSAWHAAFAGAGGEQRALAWLGAPGWDGAFEAAVGQGYEVQVLQPQAAGLRLVLLGQGQGHDVTLERAPAGARLQRAPEGALRYRAPEPGGALAYASDASAIGQRGELAMTVEPLPTELTVAPEGEGFAVEASQPMGIVLDWRPPGGPGLGLVANDAERVAAQPGAGGSLAVGGPHGRIAVFRPLAPGAEGAEVVELAAQGGVAVGAGSPWPALATSAGLGLAGLWALAPMRRRGQRQVE